MYGQQTGKPAPRLAVGSIGIAVHTPAQKLHNVSHLYLCRVCFTNWHSQTARVNAVCKHGACCGPDAVPPSMCTLHGCVTQCIAHHPWMVQAAARTSCAGRCSTYHTSSCQPDSLVKPQKVAAADCSLNYAHHPIPTAPSETGKPPVNAGNGHKTNTLGTTPCRLVPWHFGQNTQDQQKHRIMGPLAQLPI